MNDALELEAAYWLDLVGRRCDELEVEDALERQGVSLAAIHWVDERGILLLPRAGIRLHLQRLSDPMVVGVEFAVGGLADGNSYEGNLPQGIDSADTLMQITTKLHPAQPTPGNQPHSYDAVFPEYRLLIAMDGDDMLQSLTWITTRV